MVTFQFNHPHISTLDAFRYAGAHLFAAAVLLFSFGFVRCDAVWRSSLKMAQRQYKRDRAGFPE